jgi:hypothetical protein
MNLLQLRSIIETILGYYEYKRDSNGEWVKEPLPTAPGFYFQLGDKVGPAVFAQGRDRVPSNWDPKGLETIINDKPIPKITRFVGLTQRTQVWTVFLQQWDPKKTVKEPVEALLRHFGGEATATQYRKNEVDLDDRAMIQIKTIDVDVDNWPVGGPLGAVPSPVEGMTNLPLIEL